ncbi:hypothetical protein [Corynebacterium spheniscorum]|nr:hypothetical protein [Corynebacterium spheniscorum]
MNNPQCAQLLYPGHAMKILYVIDECTRVHIGVAIDKKLPASMVIELPDTFARERGRPAVIRMDNWPELT